MKPKEKLRPFHLAFPVTDLEKAREWYVDVLGCGVGRTSEVWIDFNMFGHQVVAHLVPESSPVATNKVDRRNVPASHFGMILEWDEWHKLADRLREKKIDFLFEPHIRFEGKPGEQATLFILDPSKNALEFKAFRDDKMIFAPR